MPTSSQELSLTRSPPYSSLITRHSSLARRFSAFTLVEMLVVMGIVLLLMVLLAPAFTSLKSAGDVTSAAYTIKGILDQARTYAMANNTYTWVGFYEEDSTAAVPTNSAPPYPGKGRLLTTTVFSIDGTKIFDNDATSAALPSGSIKQIGKLTRIEGLHMADIGAPPSPTPNPTPAASSLAARSGLPYTENASIVPPADHYNRVSSDSSDKTQFNFAAQSYTFYKTIRFDPRGEANMNSTYDLRHVVEIGLRPTHGNTVDNNATNVVAIQISGVGGNVKIYRQ
ncbi:MAG: prepilin-type N-terminal cleavage/methylation domain-containing protein [Chthoniobacterales bacterium]|jgi:type II secretory pathway pseudopilin PulG|nr:prepilin-type N-terminal cleavage/methylation domain-containing protein [Chthoniobacterales bacterium]